MLLCNVTVSGEISVVNCMYCFSILEVYSVTGEVTWRSLVRVWRASEGIDMIVESRISCSWLVDDSSLVASTLGREVLASWPRCSSADLYPQRSTFTFIISEQALFLGIHTSEESFINRYSRTIVFVITTRTVQHFGRSSGEIVRINIGTIWGKYIDFYCETENMI